MSHTPGPWTVANFNEQTFTVDVETVERGNDVPEKGYLIARAYCGPDGSSPDAALIAAAPDMLSMLEAVIRHDEALKPEFRLSSSLIRHIQTTIDKAKGL